MKKKASYLDISIRIAAATRNSIHRDDPFRGEMAEYALNGGVTQCFTGSVQG